MQVTKMKGVFGHYVKITNLIDIFTKMAGLRYFMVPG